MLSTTVFLTLATFSQGTGGSAHEEYAELLSGAYVTFIELKRLGFGNGHFADLRTELGKPGRNGYTLSELTEIARKKGAFAEQGKVGINYLLRLNDDYACILRTVGGHYVGFRNRGGGQYTLLDPPYAPSLPLQVDIAGWEGDAVILGRAPIPPMMVSTFSPLNFFLATAATLSVCTGLVVAVGKRWRRRQSSQSPAVDTR